MVLDSLQFSDFQSQFSMSIFIWISPYIYIFFFIKGYHSRSTFFIIDIFWKLQFWSTLFSKNEFNIFWLRRSSFQKRYFLWVHSFIYISWSATTLDTLTYILRIKGSKNVFFVKSVLYILYLLALLCTTTRPS